MTREDAPPTPPTAQGILPPWLIYLSLLIGFTAMLSPLFSNEYPLSADYLNHLSRIFVLYHRHDPFLGRIFQVHFGIIPNLGLDAIAYGMQPLGLSPNVVLKLIFTLSCLVLWSGSLAFNASVHGKLSTSSLLTLPISYSFVAVYGFYDFMLGIGLVLWCFAWLLRAQPQLKTSLLVVNCVSALIFLCHFGAWLILIVSLILYRAGNGRTWRQAVGMALGESLIPVFLYVMRIRNHFGGFSFDSIPYKLIGVVSIFQMTSIANALLTALTFFGLLAVLLHVRALHIHRRWFPLLIGLTAVSLLAPFSLQTSAFVDWRLIWITCLFFVLTVEIAPRPRWVEPLVLGAIALMILPNARALARDTSEYNENVGQFVRAITLIPRDSFVFLSSYERDTCPATGAQSEGAPHGIAPDQPRLKIPFLFYRSIPALLTLDRNSVFPYIFAQRGAEAVYVRPAFSNYFSPIPRLPLDSLIAAFLVTGRDIPLTWKNGVLQNGSELSQPPVLLSPFMYKWTQRFPYAIHMQEGCPGPGPYSGLFKEIAHGSYFTIFKVNGSPSGHHPKAMTKRTAASHKVPRKSAPSAP